MHRISSSQIPQNGLSVGLGVQFEPYPASLTLVGLAPATQTVYGIAVYGTAGSVVTGVKLRNGIAAAGTLPTTARFGVADNTGKILALSSNDTALAQWNIGVCPYPFTATLTLAYSGIYFPCFVVNGVWGTTQPVPGLQTVSSVNLPVADGSNPPVNFQWASQTDLPSVGSSLTMTSGSGRAYYLALY